MTKKIRNKKRSKSRGIHTFIKRYNMSTLREMINNHKTRIKTRRDRKFNNEVNHNVTPRAVRDRKWDQMTLRNLSINTCTLT